jgi:hypothetical protein
MPEPTEGDVAKALEEIKASLTELKGESTTTGWQKLLMLTVVVGALAAATMFIVNESPEASDAATILGIVVPVFATIGAAVFGIQVAYERGEKKAETQAQDTVNAAEQEAVDAQARSREARSAADEAKSQAAQIAGAARRLLGATHERSGVFQIESNRNEPGTDPLTELRTLANQILG